jgi:hypothetical protein
MKTSNYSRLAEMLAYAKQKGENFVYMPVGKVPDLMAELAINSSRISALEDEMDKYRNGYKGGCWTCQTVGELNIKQEARINELEAEIDDLKKELLDTTWQDHADHWQRECIKKDKKIAKLREQLDRLGNGIDTTWTEERA